MSTYTTRILRKCRCRTKPRWCATQCGTSCSGTMRKSSTAPAPVHDFELAYLKLVRRRFYFEIGPADTSSHEPSPSLPTLRVFLVGDAISVRTRMAEHFGATEGVVIIGAAEEPAAAFDGIGTSAADVVVLNLHLTGGAGFEPCCAVSCEACPR
ncbi:hypothetical protein [Paraburkholderia sp. BL6665CI2N2]|uniref:hypothetical protein n=1 Tax=Paraburkholderia sp. BL6665CI2N2 TaxID=1938806 RepID=UPI001FBC10B7|nr:hypothetical protein [Paraburkholderia sp. BL6665CI2N2]